MSSREPGYNWTAVSGGVGTTTVANRSTSLKRIIWGGTFVGTINVHNAGTAAGTTASSQIISLGNPGVYFPFSLEVNANCSEGLTYQATGTPVVTLIWD